ncbi:MAG: DNA repair exonuclease [Firmicutes bacterium]|nr:DNA repair exonuclease [Bacillota bacterium]
MHIGRRPGHLPEGADVEGISCAQAWEDVVLHAQDAGVDLVVLTGDVVDRENRYFEAFGPLEAGIRTLAQGGIRVVAVAGNHDFDVLPKLGQSFNPDEFRLVGAGGAWERLTIHKEGKPALHLDGWSFPTEHYEADPLAGYRLGPAPGPATDAPILGLLHADLDQLRSPYAPVTAAALRGLPPRFWLLGHIHAPALYEEPGRASILYPGSPLAMSPKEPGIHGPWIIEVSDTGRVEAWQVPLSRVRYEAIVIDVEGAQTVDEVDRRFTENILAHLQDAVAKGGEALTHLVCRVRLVGRTPMHRRIETRLEERARQLQLSYGRAIAVVDRISVETRPERNLGEIAYGSGPPAVLARLLLMLGGDPSDPEQERLLRKAREILREVQGAAHYRELKTGGVVGAPGDEGIRRVGGLAEDEVVTGEGTREDAGEDEREAKILALLERQGLLLLDELLAQKEEAS